MNRNSERKSPGGDKGRGSDKSKNSFSKPERGGAGRGKPEGRSSAPRGGKGFGSDKSFDDKKSGGSRGSFGGPKRDGGKSFGDKKFSDKPTRGGERSFGDKKFSDRPARDGERAPRSFGDKKFSDKPTRGGERSFGDKKFSDKPARSGEKAPKSFGDKKFTDRPSKPFGDRNKFGADKPASRGKSSYKDYEAKGKSSRSESESDDFDFDYEMPRTFGRESEYDFPFEKPGKSEEKKGKRPRVEGGKNKYQARKDNGGQDPKKSEKNADSGLAQAGIRLNKFIANSGMCSRREADVMIQNGVVTVNGKIMDELGYRVQPTDEVKFDGRTIVPEKPVYLLLNKPKDYITTAEDPQGRKTVMALIQGACKERVFPVGRLDRNTTGLLLFTNDGEMADKLMHPRKRIKKIYMVELDKNIKPDHLRDLRDGVTLEDGPIKPDAVEYAEGPKMDKKILGVEIHSGRNRIVRRMFEHFGYKVVKLDRVFLAGLTKKNLPRGHYRMLDPMEINMLKML